MNLLRDIDEKYVPRAAEALDRLFRRFPKPPEPDGPLPVILRLRHLDDRWTASGPLATLRDIPQLGAVAIAAIVLVSGVTARGRIEERRAAEARSGNQSDQLPPAGEAPHEGTLGPQVGQSVDGYLDDARKKLQTVAAPNAGRVGLAVISFGDYKTPEEVRDLIGLNQVHQIFFRAAGLKVNQATVQTAPVQDIVADSKAAFRKRAQVLRREATNNRNFAKTIENDPAQKREHERDAALYEFEAKILRGPCQCIFAVVVRSAMRQFMDIARVKTVRVVDISDVDAKIEDFTFSALLPEEKVTVTGGNEE